ncbi:hypothetical protein UF75_4556 [Desulfosporosinus sp. I2]|nr:hypothetical protein UF75_4556 [Desulfosporosinus sp. I2]
MQRVGRVDRRRNQDIELKLLSDHPDIIDDRDDIHFWNFLPPDELEKLLLLYSTVSKKTLRISRAFGIEGKQLLTPSDDYDTLKDFNSAYEGTETKEEEMVLAYESLIKDNPEYESNINSLPVRMYSGKKKSDIKGIFFCYKLPIKNQDGEWSIDEGICKWYVYNSDQKSITEFAFGIWKEICCDKSENRILTVTAEGFSEIRKLLENYIKRTYLKSVQAPIGVKQKLTTWMELY